MGYLRQPHRLKKNKGTEVPDRVIFFDTETKSVPVEDDLINHQLKLGVACFYNTRSTASPPREVWWSFRTPEDFWDKALSYVTLNTRVVFVAHNLSFDFLVLSGLSALQERSWYAKSLIIHHSVNIWTFVQYQFAPGSPEWIKCEHFSGKRPRVVKSVVFLDLMNYFNMSLAALGKSMGTPKWEINFETCTEDDLLEYCRNDVFIMVEAWKKWCGFLVENNLGTFGKTLPSQAFNAYRHRFMKHKVFIHSHEKALALERQSYSGGRCECFRIGHYDQGPYYLLDVNSMYPYVMRENEYPTKLITYLNNGTIKDLERYVENHAVIAEVFLVTPTPAYPVKLHKRLVFPTGTFWATLTTPELIYALESDHVHAVRHFALYEKASIFSEYVDFFWKARQGFTESGNTAYRELCKKMLNCLYGKFGQKLDEYTAIAEDPEHKIEYWRDYDVDKAEWLKFKCVNGKISVASGHIESFNSFPAIAAHVTAYARQELLKHIVNAGKGHVYYCDTDSVIVDVVGSMNLINAITDKKLGGLHMEKMSDTVTIRNVKDYTFAGKRRTKGIMGKADKLGKEVFGQWQQISLRSVLWNNYTDNCFWQYVRKHLQKEYKKGIVNDSGVVRPFVLTQTL